MEKSAIAAHDIDASASRRTDRRFLALLLGLTVAYWVPQLHGPIDARSDGAVYYILGTSLAEGRGYRLLNEPGEIAAVQYPPLLPLVVAAFHRILGSSDFAVVGAWLRRLYFLVALALTAATYVLARRYLPPRRALLAGAISGAALHVWYLSGVLYGEIPFSLMAVSFVLCARQAGRTTYWLATAALGVAGYLLRTAGIALLAAWVVEALLAGSKERPLGRRVLQAAVRTVIAFVPVLAWQAYVGSVTSSPAYTLHPAYAYQRAAYQYSNVPYLENMSLVSPFVPEEGRLTTVGWLSRIARNLAVVPASLGGAVTAQRAFWEMTVARVDRFLGRELLPTSAAVVPMTALGSVVLAGAAVMVRRRQWLVPLVCAAATGSMCLTPWPEQFVRYYTPMIPFLSIMLVTTLGVVVDRDATGAAWWGRRSAAVAVLVLVFAEDAFVTTWTFVVRGVTPVIYEDAGGRSVRGPLLFYDDRAAALDEALGQVRRRARPGDVMATSMPHWAFLRTGVKAILPPMEADRDEARRLLDTVPVRFVVLDELTYPGISQRYAAPAVEEDRRDWQQVYRTDDGLARVYERR